MDEWIVEQRLSVRDRVQRRGVHDQEAVVAHQFGEDLIDPGRAEQLGGVGRKPAGCEHRQVWEIAKRPHQQTSRAVLMHDRRREPLTCAHVEVPGKRGPAQIELSENDVASRQRHRMRQIDRHGRLALAGDGARHEQRVELAGDCREVERAAQDAVWLQERRSVVGMDGAKRRLRNTCQCGQTVGALEILDRLDPPVQRLQQEHDRECERKTDEEPDRRGCQKSHARGRSWGSGDADDVGAPTRHRSQPGETLLGLFQRSPGGRAGRQRDDLRPELAFGRFDPCHLSVRLEGDVVVGEGVREARRVPWVVGRRGDVQDIGIGRGFDRYEFEQFARAFRALQFPAYAFGHLTGVGYEHLGVRGALGFAAATRRDLQGRIRQGFALECNAGGRLIGLRSLLVARDGYDQAGRDDPYYQQPPAPQRDERPGEAVAFPDRVKPLREAHAIPLDGIPL